MGELILKDEIEKHSMDLLKQSKALDIFPTPIERIVSCADLIVSGEVDLAHHKESFIARIGNKLSSSWDHIRGFLDRREKVIYLDKSCSTARQNFVKLHEVGHEILPWQAQILSYADNDDTLSPSVKEEFEAEANFFASATFFQQDRFDREVRNMGVGVQSARAISKKFGASIHATLRRMVEHQTKSCALIVLEKRTRENCSLRDIFQSNSFTKDFGLIFLPEKLNREIPIAADYLNNRRLLLDKVAEIPTTSGLHKLKYEFFFNGFNAFILAFPAGELAKPKLRYAFLESERK